MAPPGANQEGTSGADPHDQRDEMTSTELVASVHRRAGERPHRGKPDTFPDCLLRELFGEEHFVQVLPRPSCSEPHVTGRAGQSAPQPSASNRSSLVRA